MTPGWVFTGQNLTDGRPVFQCRVCRSRIWGWNVTPHSCNGEKPVPQTSKTLPCVRRGEIHGKLDCCNVIFRCSLHDYCVINQAYGKVGDVKVAICLTCPDRKETHET